MYMSMNDYGETMDLFFLKSINDYCEMSDLSVR